MLPAKLAISYMNIFTFFDNLKETIKFWAIGCHVKGPLPPPLRTECQVRTGGGGGDMAGPIFPP
jgi:hypothetical protein